MLKIRQLKAQQDAEKKAQAESGTPAQPKQTPGQLRIQKGERECSEVGAVPVAELTSGCGCVRVPRCWRSELRPH